MTPEQAAGDGAVYLVLGRAVTAAEDPAAVLASIRETLKAGSGRLEGEPKAGS